MKIGFVLDDSLDPPDGVQQAVVTTGKWLRGQGHDVHYLVGRTERVDLENVHSLARSVRVRFNGNSMSTPLPASGTALKKFLIAEKFDVLHVQMPYSPFFAAKIVKLAPPSTKIVGTFHILPYSKMSALATKQLGRVLRNSLKRFNHFVSVSQPAKNFAKASFGVESVVIPNPVNTAEFMRARKTHLLKGSHHIVFLGRLEERKGIVELLKAYRLLLENDPSLIKGTHLSIGGKGNLKVRIHELIMQLPRGSSVEMLGFVPEQDKAALLADAYLAVFQSTSGESFGIILVEAMAAGARVIIAGDNPGYASVLGEKPELLVNPRDTKAFAKTLAWGLRDSEDLRNCSEWLHSEAKRYDIAEVGNQLLDLYNT